MGAVVAGALFSVGTTAYALTAFAVNVAIAYAIGRMLAPDEPNISEESRQLKRTIRSPASPRRIIYGETLVGGNLVFVETTGTTNQYLHMVIAYAGHAVHDIGDVYINDTLSTDARFGTKSPDVTVIEYYQAKFLCGSSTPTNKTYYIEIDGAEYSASTVSALSALLPSSTYTATYDLGTLTITGLTADSEFAVNNAWVNADCNNNGVYSNSVHVTIKSKKSSTRILISKHNGSSDQDADSDLVSAVAAWTTEHRLRGIAYMYVRLTYDDDVWLTGIPEIRAVIRGKQIYNPTTTKYEWTDNWALCVRDYLTSEYGLGCADSEIETTLMNAAIATADEEVEHPGPGRYKLEWGWNDISDLSGWGTTNCTMSEDTTDPDHDNILITPTSTDPRIYKSSISIEGYVYYKVRALVKRISGTSWQGICFYGTSGHSHTYSYYKYVDAPSGIDSGWVVVEWDMSALTLGGTDWLDNTITSIRLDLSGDGSTQYRVAFVSVAKPYKRYTCNGAFALDQTPTDIMEKVLTAGAGSLVYSQGKYRLFAGEYHTPTVTLDESDLRGPIKVRPRQSRKEVFNEIKGLYIEPGQFWESVEFPIVQNSTYVSQDNDEVITREIELPFTQDAYTAQRIAKIHLEKARQGITIEYPCKLTALQLSAMDTVMVTNAAFGWSSKVFRILSWSLSQDGGVDIVMQEEAAAIYDWDNGDPTFVDPAPDTNLPSPWTLTALASITLNSSVTHHITNADGSTAVRIYVTWSKNDDRQKGFDVEYRISGQSNWQRNTTYTANEYDYIVVPIDGTDYDVRVRAVSEIGVSSDWTSSLNHTVPTGNIATSFVDQGNLAILDQVDWDTHIENNPKGTFTEYFDGPGPTDDNWRWTNYSGSGELSISSDSETGGSALSVGDNSGNDQIWLIADKSIPFNPATMYKMTVISKRTQGSGVVYFGVAGRNADDTQWVNASGLNAPSSQHYIAAAGHELGSTYEVNYGYFKGHGTPVNGTNTNTIDSPSPLHANVRHFRPLILVNYNAQAGTTLIDSVIIEEAEYGAVWSDVAGTGKPDDNADVTQGAIETGITITAGYLTGGTDTLLLDYANRRFTGGDETWQGVGWQFEYNSGAPRLYFGNGDKSYISIDTGTDEVDIGQEVQFNSVDAYYNIKPYQHFFLGGVGMTSATYGTGSFADTDPVSASIWAYTVGDIAIAWVSLSTSQYDYSWNAVSRFKVNAVSNYSTGVSERVYFGMGYIPNSGSKTFVGFYVNNGNIYGMMENTNTSASVLLTAEAGTGTATLYEIVFDGQNDNAKFYINGAYINEVTSSAANPSVTDTTDIYANNIISIAAFTDTGGGTCGYSFGEYKYLSS